MYCTELIWQILDNDLHLLSLPENKKERKRFILLNERHLRYKIF